MNSTLNAGIREARQNLSRLLEEVRRGREVTITDRGKAVARLVPPVRFSDKPFRSRTRQRKKIRLSGEPLSQTIESSREDRL